MVLQRNQYGNFFNTRSQPNTGTEISGGIMAASNTGTAGSDNGAGDVKDPNAGNEKIGDTTESTKSGTSAQEQKSNFALIIAVIACAVAIFGKK